MYKKLVGIFMCSAAVHGQFQLTSPAFNNGEPIDKKYACEIKAGNKVPELSWSGAPAGTKSFALICEDPDAPAKANWTHWVIFNIPGTKTKLKISSAEQHEEELSDGSKQGINDMKNIGYDGPCPPSGTHRYIFRIYALDTKLDLPPGSTKSKLIAAMNGHIKAKTELMGTYAKGSSKKTTG